MKLAIPVLALLLALGIYLATRQPPEISETKIPTNRLETMRPSGVHSQLNPTIQTNSAPSAQPVFETATNVSREAIERQIESLTDASAKSDSKSFQLIVNALNDPQAEIRQTAVEAAIQFGSRDAIPFLKEAAANIEDAREKVKILDAIEFLELPSFSEIKQARATNSNSSRIPATSK